MVVVSAFDHIVWNGAEFKNFGILDMRRGLGYFVAENAVETILSRRREAFKSVQAAEFFETARTLGLTPQELSDLYGKYLDETR